MCAFIFRYRLGDADSPDESSDDEEEEYKPVPSSKGNPQRKPTNEQLKTPSSKPAKNPESTSRGALPKKGLLNKIYFNLSHVDGAL